eukprot:458697_1
MNILILSLFVSISTVVQFCAVSSEFVDVISKPHARRLLAAKKKESRFYLRDKKTDRIDPIDVEAYWLTAQLWHQGDLSTIDQSLLFRGKLVPLKSGKTIANYFDIISDKTSPEFFDIVSSYDIQFERFLNLLSTGDSRFKKQNPHYFTIGGKIDQSEICKMYEFWPEYYEMPWHKQSKVVSCSSSGQIVSVALDHLRGRTPDLSQLTSFTELKRLTISDGTFRSIDWRPLTRIRFDLTIQNNGMNYLDLSALTALRGLEIWGNRQLESITFPTLGSLQALRIMNNRKLKDIDLSPLSQCVDLHSLQARNNYELTAIRFPASPNWKSLRQVAFGGKGNLYVKGLLNLEPLSGCPALKRIRLQNRTYVELGDALNARVLNGDIF